MMDKTIVLPSARAIRQEQQRTDLQTLFLPNYITINDFISKLCIVKEFKVIDNDTRILLLLEASDFKAFSSLQIQRNFFTFTKNSSYIFKFFEELSAELYDIELLDTSDIYAEYEEHITILRELYKRYEQICLEKKVLDKIFLPKLYKFNELYAKSHSSVELHIDGHLTNFELELLNKCKEFTQIELVFSTSRFNTKMQQKLSEEIAEELEVGYEYTISFNQSRVLSKIKREQNKKISCESFSESILQVAFVKKKIYEYIRKGYLAENIALILPDENMAKTLKSFDDKFNLNFAMGESYRYTKIYEKLNATCQLLDQKSKENFARLERVEDSAYVDLLGIYFKNFSEVDILEFLNEFKERYATKKEMKIFEEEIYAFKNILPYLESMNVKSALSLFMQRLSQRSLDDVRGGKITVMGVLETRSVDFDGVIIVDFNDANVPKKSDKDMFLNTQIRENANLPTMSDRENLQKHYYDLLINRSKDVSISYVNSKDSSGSRFLKQLNINQEASSKELEYANIIFKRTFPHAKSEKEIILPYSFRGKKISATKLKTFLSCKRKYYYKHIKYISGHEIPKDMPKEYEIGNNVHKALANLYTKKDTYDDVAQLRKDLNKELDLACGESELDKYLIAMQKKRLESFCEQEILRFKKAWHVQSCEKRFECEYSGAILEGYIDRIDKRDNEIYVLDYKTGSYPLYTKNNFSEATDFQMEFYYLLAGGLGNVVGCAYYDLKESKLVEEPFLSEKLAVLKSNLVDLLQLEEINFSKCEDEKNCQFCDYKIICGRDK